MRKVILAAVLALLASAAHAQSVSQSGAVTIGHIPRWVSNGIIGDGGTSADSPITSIGITNEGGSGLCVASGRQTAAGRNLLCLSAATAASAKISLQNYGTAVAQNLDFVINGTTVTLPTGGGTFVLANGPFVAGHAACWLNTSGVLVDCGAGIGAGTQYGLAYYSAAGTVGSTAAGTNGQIPVATTSAAPAFKTLSGDVGSVSAAGAVVLQSVNGVPFSTSYTNHGVLLAQGSSAFTSTTTANVGYCLLSQGTSSDPVWAACASGAGSAGGSNTQVQYNNSTSLDGSVNLTWVSPALRIGVAGTTTGQLQLASSTASGVVTLQAPGVSGTYNFNWPTGAGTTGQPMISGGGGSTPNTFGTLGVFGGGTNCAAASGTCLDNITGFSSTGFVQRTGSGTYAFSTTIPVSGGGTGLASGTSGGILGFTASGTIASSVLLTQYGLVYGGGAGATPVATAAGTNGQIPVANTSAAPAFVTLSGDITTVSAAGLVTIANSAITNAKLANAAGYSLKGNFTASSAAPQDSTIGGLTQKASPGSNDLILIQDQAASGQLKYATVSSVSAAGSVASIAGNTGAFTLSNGITNSTNDIRFQASTAAVIAVVKKQTFCASGCTTTVAGGGSGTYTPSTGIQYAIAECVGGGGGGGGVPAQNTGYDTAGGGGAGSSSRVYLTAADIGASKSIGIGAGGAGGVAGGNNGTAGGDTSVGVLCVGKGGGGGKFANLGVQIGQGGVGGVAGTGDVVSIGAPGQGGSYFTATSPAMYSAGGGGGSSKFGGGAVGAAGNGSQDGTAATGYGGGGGGAVNNAGVTNQAGGAGFSGIVIITEFTNQ